MRREKQGRQAERDGAGVRLASLVSLVSFLLLSSPSLAFDSEEWLGRRELFAREAERLRAVYAQCAASVRVPAENVTIPVETFEDGSVRVVILAKKVQYFLDKGLIWGEGVTVRRLRPDGTVEARIEARNCVVDRASRSGWAEGPALVVHDRTAFRGKGVYFSASDGYVRVLEDSDVESSGLAASPLPAVRAKADGKSARITSRTADLDRQSGVAMFEGGVVVRYADEYTMCADRAFAFFAGTNELSRVVALGSVSVTNEARVGTCAMATYRRRRDEIEMFGNGTNALARLADRGNGANVLEGARIRFWLNAGQVEVSGTRISSEEKGAVRFL